MWFDVQQALSEIEGGTLPTLPPKPVTPASPLAPVGVADVASVATPPALNGKTDHHRHGVSVAGHPLTWTGRVVSLADWRRLTAWERHGPDGQHWNGITQQWEHPKGNQNEQ